MKIICIGRNYSEHAKELNNPVNETPVIFLKPDSAILDTRLPFFIPDFSDNIHYEVELVVRINRLGKNIEPRFAKKYYNEITTGIDFTARDLQSELKKKGLPWELAKGFDGSAAVGQFIAIDDAMKDGQIRFSLQKNDEVVQEGLSKDMIFGIDEIIAYASQFFTLKKGDLIFTGTPAGVGMVEKDDILRAFIGTRELLKVKIK
jgi:2-keto-4-pentenoate hydratase/2-oxohepta-3-ene-1,7-dioic acid hydratase in catechol pathway